MQFSKTFLLATLAILGAASPVNINNEEQQPMSMPNESKSGLDITVTVHVPSKQYRGVKSQPIFRRRQLNTEGNAIFEALENQANACLPNGSK